MTLQRLYNLNDAEEWFIRLSRKVEASTALNHLDLNVEVENFFRDLLNLLRGWSLQNANWSNRKNQDSFDLEDRARRIAVQVTSTMSAGKIRDSLKTFVTEHRGDFDRLIFIYPHLSKTRSTADFRKLLGGFDFDPERDRFDLGDLLAEMRNADVEKQRQVLCLLQRELKPLGQALQMGVDQNVEAIIAVIQHMSSGLPDARPEMKPDAEKKLRRFKQYAEYLKRQYMAYVSSYRAVAEARDAVGYDAVRAVRCTAWLKDRSITALETHRGNAAEAFDALVAQLVEIVHKTGVDCDESAMRYFLADEFGRCNVFPNPAEVTR